MNQKALLVIVAVVCLVVGAGGGYFARGALRPQMGFRNGQGRGGQFGQLFGGGAGGRPLIGMIQSTGNDRLTLTTPDGSSHIVLISSDTKYHKVTDGSLTDFPTGTRVIVVGSQNSDGSMTATSVQAAPQN